MEDFYGASDYLIFTAASKPKNKPDIWVMSHDKYPKLRSKASSSISWLWLIHKYKAPYY